MKVVRIPIFVLLLTLTFSLVNSATLSDHCQSWSAQLSQIDSDAQEHHWDAVQEQLDSIESDWTQCQTWLHIVIDHKEIDSAQELLERCQVLAQEADDVEFRSTLAELRCQLQLLDEMERVSIKNIL